MEDFQLEKSCRRWPHPGASWRPPVAILALLVLSAPACDTDDRQPANRRSPVSHPQTANTTSIRLLPGDTLIREVSGRGDERELFAGRLDGTYSLYLLCAHGHVVIRDSRNPNDPWRAECSGIVHRLQIYDEPGPIDLRLLAPAQVTWVFAVAERE